MGKDLKARRWWLPLDLYVVAIANPEDYTNRGRIITRSKGRAIITASRPTGVSIELTELGHGTFTYYPMQGPKGAADLNRNGIVTL